MENSVKGTRVLDRQGEPVRLSVSDPDLVSLLLYSLPPVVANIIFIIIRPKLSNTRQARLLYHQVSAYVIPPCKLLTAPDTVDYGYRSFSQLPVQSLYSSKMPPKLFYTYRFNSIQSNIFQDIFNKYSFIYFSGSRRHNTRVHVRTDDQLLRHRRRRVPRCE